MLTKLLLSALAVASVAVVTSAAPMAGTQVRVTISGTVFSNAIVAPPLGNAAGGNAASISFLLDSSVFQNHATLPTRGYPIDTNSWVLTLGTVSMPLQNPYPGTPYFLLRNNDPSVDGFMVTSDLTGPNGVALAQNGTFGAFRKNFYVTYTGNTLSSLDLLGALGTYAYSGLTTYNWTIDDGPFNPMIIDFATITIETVGGATLYCQGKVNSQGCTPSLSAPAGLPSLSGAPWMLTASNLLNQQLGVFVYGTASNNSPFQGGTLCVLPPVVRTLAQNSGGNVGPMDCSGAIQLDLTTTIPGPGTVFLQVWARDPFDAFGSSLSNAVEVQVTL